MKYKMSRVSVMLSWICSLALIVVLFVPMWRIDLVAPQYPEGLFLQIFPHKLGGDVEIINGLNHYIGMKTLHTSDFIEFRILPYIIGGLALMGFLVAFFRKRIFYYGWVIIYVLFGIVAMYDFYRWEYNYGHNLDPNAAIVVPGMAYQPPLIGYKQLLNFGAYSFPDIGGYIFITVGVLMLSGILFEWRLIKRSRTTLLILWMSVLMTVQSCSTEVQPIRFGSDACSFCKMVISDPRFGAELITHKGKVYKFDDVQCLIGYIKQTHKSDTEVGSVFMVDYSQTKNLYGVEKMQLLSSDMLNSPMGGNIAAFSNSDSLNRSKETLLGDIVLWKDLVK
jgi:copper chaperone NosL